MDFQKDFQKVLLSQPHVILGKKGITDQFLSHVLKLLKKYKIIKIKVLKSIAYNSNIKEIANQISKETKSYLIDVRGKKFILSKYPIKKK
ncbi:MAG: YhbY family RNA-binding protein [Promethearchaeota archaeon]